MRLYAKGQSFFNARNQKNPFAVKSARLSRANIEFVNLPAYIIPAMLRLLRIFVLTAFASLFVCVGARAGQINNIRLGALNGSQVRIVVDLSHKTVYTARNLSDAAVTVDLNDTPPKDVAPFLRKKPDYLAAMQAVKIGAKNTRITFKFNKKAQIKKTFLLAPQSGFQWRLVIDLTLADALEKAAKSKPETPSGDDGIASLIAAAGTLPETPFAFEQDEPAPAPPAKKTPQSNEKPLIVLDAGHGGKDPGAIGRTYKTKEKDITLALVKQLRDRLVKTGRYRVRLTRESDVAISLWGRRKFAHDIKADLFISIHADSSANNPKAKGLSIYTLSEKASDKEAEKLAERENKADILTGLDLSAETQEVTDILIDLARRETNNHSSFFAEGFVKELRKEVTVLPNAHRFAGFAVLKSPDVPSVLIETGYLSNREEETLLRQPAYREKLAVATTRAINKYFDEKHKANFN